MTALPSYAAERAVEVAAVAPAGFANCCRGNAVLKASTASDMAPRKTAASKPGPMSTFQTLLSAERDYRRGARVRTSRDVTHCSIARGRGPEDTGHAGQPAHALPAAPLHVCRARRRWAQAELGCCGCGRSPADDLVLSNAIRPVVAGLVRSVRVRREDIRHVRGPSPRRPAGVLVCCAGQPQ
jgi:hypothetical protein